MSFYEIDSEALEKAVDAYLNTPPKDVGNFDYIEAAIRAYLDERARKGFGERMLIREVPRKPFVIEDDTPEESAAVLTGMHVGKPT